MTHQQKVDSPTDIDAAGEDSKKQTALRHAGPYRFAHACPRV